jgi:hypothetical protein
VTGDPRQTDPFQPAPPADPLTRQAAEPYAQPLAPVTPSSPSPGAASSRKRGGGVLLVNLLLGVALVVAVGGVAFAVGRATAPAAVAATGPGNGQFGNGNPNFRPNASGAPGGGFVGGGNGGFFGAGGLSVQGTVTAVTADSITIQLANGQSVTIPIDSQTTYHSQTAASAADVKAGSTVIVALEGGRGAFPGTANGNGGPAASGQPTRTTPAARSITLAPAGS